MRRIETSGAPLPAGHYSQGVIHRGVVYVAGQLALDPETRAVVEGGAYEQTVRTMRNVEAVLVAAGSSLAELLSVTVYVTDHAYWADVNRAFADVMGTHRPARAIVPVPALRAGCLVEIQGTAVTSASDSPDVPDA